jgi:hypothetical protein
MGERVMERIVLYDGVGQGWFDLAQVMSHLEEWLGCARVESGGGLFPSSLSEAAATRLAEQVCGTRILDSTLVVGPRSLLRPEFDYELRLLSGGARPAAGVLYDGNELQRIAFRFLPLDSRVLEVVNIWFTERLCATWDENDRRYHTRVSIYGQPSIISTSGMLYAPARKRSYYLARRAGLAPSPDSSSDGKDFLKRGDARISDVARGYAMQAVFFAITGKPFCEDPRCRLFNAHWQSEMLEAQLGGGDYCGRHREIMKSWSDAQPILRESSER